MKFLFEKNSTLFGTPFSDLNMTDDWGDVNTGEWGSSIKTTGPPPAEKTKTQKSEKPEKSKKAPNQKISEKKPEQKVSENQPKKKRNRNKFKPGYEPKRPKIDLENSEKLTQPSKPVESKPVRPKKFLKGQKAEKTLDKKFENKFRGPKEKKKRVRKSRNKFKQGIENIEQKSEKSDNETPSKKIEEIEENPIEEDRFVLFKYFEKKSTFVVSHFVRGGFLSTILNL